MTTDAVPAIERVLDLAAPPDRVWRAITDEGELAAWLGTGARFRPEAGADGWLEFGEDERYALRVESVEPGRAITWRWARDAGVALDVGPTTLVELRVSAGVGDGTRLTLRESGFVRDRDRSSNCGGWAEELADLVGHLAVQPWEAGVRRTWQLRSAPARVWAAIAEPAQLAAWWGGGAIAIAPGASGWWDWPELGRYAVTIDAVEPIDHLAWRWTTAPGVALDAADEILRTWFTVVPRADGGTDLHLLETGFRGPDAFRENGRGWDVDVLPSLIDLVDGAG